LVAPRFETSYALKQILDAGVRVFLYLEDRERRLDSALDAVMLSLTTFADQLEREKGRQRVIDSHNRKARAGHVTGGRCFGYENIEILTADGRRDHVDCRIKSDEAAVVREIFARCAGGQGLKTIAKELNARRLPTPRDRLRVACCVAGRRVLFGRCCFDAPILTRFDTA